MDSRPRLRGGDVPARERRENEKAQGAPMGNHKGCPYGTMSCLFAGQGTLPAGYFPAEGRMALSSFSGSGAVFLRWQSSR